MCNDRLEHFLTEAKKGAATKRLKLWELDSHWHCSIVGTCFSASEIRKLAAKCNVPTYNGRMADYKRHSYMVSIARYSQNGGKLLHKHLERKYARIIKQLSECETSQELEAKWIEAYNGGDIAGHYWAVLTHPCAAYDLKQQIYGEIHMLSHLEGASNRADHELIAELKAANDRLQSDLQDSRKSNRLMIDRRDQQIASLRASMNEQSEKLASVKKDPEKTERLEKNIVELTRLLSEETARADRAELRLARMELKMAALEQEKQVMKVKQEPVQVCSHQETCDGLGDLCGRCIAYIGGQTKQAAHFKEYVEKNNGKLLHHDGGLHDGQARLKNILSQADAVMFPVTCVSHEASREIKKTCIQEQKPFVPLRSKGLGAFTRGLESLQGEFFEKNPMAEADQE